ncbi:FGGY of carbohydrate kinase, C-terminal domain family protein [Candida parapsilosis]|uniref:FGGY_C domain-containing protein n=2 Tax=Candida parapsilosis TaxID=5480 RepID=G8BGZ1_CANPC|nr:uncharacterized protein CPAR2_503630 [Candida parapsilosis]KAF6044747.1 FGGY of carbohydrate kinase, C-terminal domain family protein [Candida parapsilosis]KAF6044866.1 FGGY of carbohydrate kinase, C-terminal domain family protein [Candida parapsilosis]KAF6048987.1 FGGY of carbohydrate kinase, C-terminal domain family protein [Candida parapsilosis]KAF6060987.1 FGGY of carbohydrate kinase, C-terminal domain family protein [Candida parapsilosis]CAD1813316.1 unnamed protein product [Candida pa
MIIDNPNGPFGLIINTITLESLLAEYSLIMEFLVFQARQLFEPLSINSLFVSGSQCKNDLFLQLLASVCNVTVTKIDANCCPGAAKMGRVAHLCQQGWTYDDAFDEVTRSGTATKMVHPGDYNSLSSLKDELALLLVKYEIYLDMEDEQRQYRNMMN